MTFRKLSIFVSLIFAATALSSCSDDDSDFDGINDEPEFILGSTSTGYELGKTVSIESEQNHQSGQKHRSSGNFSTSGMIDGEKTPSYMVVSCPEGITFDIKVDKTGTDETWVTNVYNGAILNYRQSDKLYISDPKNASSKFKVYFKALFPNENHVFVSSPGSPLSGQDHRASINFSLHSGATRYKVECSNANASFNIYEDVTGTDRKIAANVKHGDIINLSSSRTNYYIHDPKNTSNKTFQVHFEPYVVEWMTPLSDALKLSEITIPGTHDTATGNVGPGLSKCQNFNFAQQLDFGLRYFDVRFDDNMKIYHGPTDCHMTLTDVLNDCNRFLEAHPREAIILQVAQTSSGMPGKFADFIKNNAGLTKRLYRKTSVAKLGDVRGKIVIFRRFSLPNTTEDWGVNLADCWPPDGVFSGKTDDGIDVHIEDRYFSTSEAIHDSHEKRDKFNEAVDHAVNNPGCLTIAFSSIAGRATHTPWDYAWGGGPILEVDPIMSEVVNSKVKDVASKHTSPVCAGIIVLDYYNKEGHDDYFHNVERIINLNFSSNSPIIDLNKLHSDSD